TPWAVMVSEFMLQQTPVRRVLPVYDAWLERWAEPAALASEPAGEAIRAWGRLGYPRRGGRGGRSGCTPQPGRSSSDTAARYPRTPTRCGPFRASATTPPPRSGPSP